MCRISCRGAVFLLAVPFLLGLAIGSSPDAFAKGSTAYSPSIPQSSVPQSNAFQSSADPPPRGDRVITLTETLTGAVGGVAVDRLGIIYVATFGETVYKVTPDGRVSLFAEGMYGTSGNAIDADGNLFQASFYGDYITKISRNGDQKIFADEGLQGPVGITVDPDGNLYVCNCRGNYLSRINKGGEVTKFAESDLFNCPNGITRGPDGNLFVVNFSNGRMLKVTPEGTVSEFALIPGGGNGHVTLARGTLYATSFRGQRLYRVSLDGEVTHFAGTGALGEDDGAALDATFSWPNGVAAGPLGDRLYINDYINRFPPTVAVPPVPQSTVRLVKLASLSDEMLTALQTDGIEAMVKAHRDWENDASTGPVFTEVEINALGYQLMGSGQLEAAIEVFKLNVEAYPNSWNVYDSLGEAYMNAGEKQRAIQFYEKSIEINPANTNGLDMLKKLRQ